MTVRNPQSVRCSAVISGPGLTKTSIAPGETVKIGRHETNDLVLPDTEVSRFHARFLWPLDSSFPVIQDCDSQNGTMVDGEALAPGGMRSIGEGALIEIGSFALEVQLAGCDPALLEDTDEVALYTDDGPELQGRFDAGALPELLKKLERTTRTGTLVLDLPGGPSRITFCLGRMMAIEHGTLTRSRALEHLLAAGKGRYRFTLDLEPIEEPLELWFSDWCACSERSGTPTDSYKTRKQPA